MHDWICKDRNSAKIGSFYFDTPDYFAGILLDSTLQFGYINGPILKVPTRSRNYTKIKTLIDSLSENPTEDEFDTFWEQCFAHSSFSYKF